MKRIFPIIALIFSIQSCLLPDLIPIQWKTSEQDAKLILSQFIEQDKIEIYPSCQKTNDIEHHIIGVTITNSELIPESENDKELLAEKIAISLYPEITNSNKYEFIGVIFYFVQNGFSETYAATMETKAIKAKFLKSKLKH